MRALEGLLFTACICIGRRNRDYSKPGSILQARSLPVWFFEALGAECRRDTRTLSAYS